MNTPIAVSSGRLVHGAAGTIPGGYIKHILLAALSLSLSLAWHILPGAASAEASGLKADEEVVFFPTAAHLDVERNRWVVPVHGWVFEGEEGSIWRSALLDELIEWLELPAVQKDETIFRGRARMFLVDSQRGKRLDLRAAGLTFRASPSDPNGHFRGTAELPADLAADRQEDGWLPYLVETGDGRKFYGKSLLVPPGGFSVISDIDDTIKISGVLDKEELLVNTFLREYQPVPAMAEACRRWAEEGAAFHYISGSPWQLYPFLAGFMSREGFPPGSFELRNFRIKDRTFFNLFSSPREVKIPAIESLIARFPGRRFILVGDSGESDPEIYGEVARNHPDQVVRVFIREIPGGALSGERITRAFMGVERDRWAVFREPGELPETLLPP